MARLPDSDRFIDLEIEQLYGRLESQGHQALRLQRWGEEWLRRARRGAADQRKDALEMHSLGGEGLVRWVKDLREEIADLEIRLSP